ARRDRFGHVGDVSYLRSEVAGHGVHRVGEVLPRARHPFYPRLAAQNTVGAHLAGYAGDLRRNRPQLIHHRVDGAFHREELAFDVDLDLLREVALRDGGGHVRDVADLRRQVAGHGVHRVGEVLPGAGHAFYFGLTAELAFGADLARHA